MSRLVALVVAFLVASFVASGAVSAVAEAASSSTFVCRVAYPPLEAKLKAAGGDRSRIVRPRAAADLDRLLPGKRYKFVVDEAGSLAIAPEPADAPSNEYVHPILAGGAPVETAGGLTVDKENGKRRVVVDQDSQAYCPTLKSLDAAKRALERIGVPSTEIVTRDQPPKCK